MYQFTYQSESNDFYFQPDYNFFAINIFTKKDSVNNEYNKLLTISYICQSKYKQYFIEYVLNDNKSLVLFYDNNDLYKIDFKINDNNVFYLYNKHNKQDKWHLKLDRNTIIQNNITLTEEQIKTTDSFLKEISNIPIITPVINESLAILNINAQIGIQKLEEKIKLQKIKQQRKEVKEEDEEVLEEGGGEKVEEENLQNLEKALTAIEESRFFINGITKLKLMKEFEFEGVNNELLNEVVKFLYDKMSSCYSKEKCEEMIKSNMEHKYEYGNDIYKLKNIYEKFYFQYFISENQNQIQINILTKKQNTTNKYNQLLNIGYNFTNENYYIEYFIDDDKSFTLWYNNCLYKIDFRINNNNVFYLFKPYKHINNWELYKYKKHTDNKLIQDDILIEEQIQQIKTTDSFLKSLLLKEKQEE